MVHYPSHPAFVQHSKGYARRRLQGAMQVVKPRAALLSNHEVLNHFLSYQTDNHAIRDAFKKNQQRMRADANDDHERRAELAASEEEETADKRMAKRAGNEDFAFVTEEVVKYLTSPIVPTSRQTPEGIETVMQELRTYKLTKTEQLQVINWCPMRVIDILLYVEEAIQRWDAPQWDYLFLLIHSTLLPKPPSYDPNDPTDPNHPDYAGPLEGEEAAYDEYAEEENMANMDMGGGSGQVFDAENKWPNDVGGVENERDGEIDG